MVVIDRAYGFRIVIYTQDHQPADVHVTGSGQAKVNLVGAGGLPELVYSIGISRTDLRRLMTVIAAKQGAFLREWERIHGPIDRSTDP
jgi:Domain of unknown function (DUF4160)